MISLVNRIKYYFAWVFVECICNLSGLGFSGIDSKTNIAKYDRATGIHIYEFEVCSLNFSLELINFNLF